MLPTGKPTLVAPDFERKQSMAGIQSNIEKCKKYMRYGDCIWWTEFLQRPNEMFKIEIDWYFDSILQYQDVVVTDVLEVIDANSPLGLVMRKERSIVEIRIGYPLNTIFLY